MQEPVLNSPILAWLRTGVDSLYLEFPQIGLASRLVSPSKQLVQARLTMIQRDESRALLCGCSVQ